MCVKEQTEVCTLQFGFSLALSSCQLVLVKNKKRPLMFSRAFSYCCELHLQSIISPHSSQLCYYLYQLGCVFRSVSLFLCILGCVYMKCLAGLGLDLTKVYFGVALDPHHVEVSLGKILNHEGIAIDV